jgi:hypothetical protein
MRLAKGGQGEIYEPRPLYAIDSCTADISTASPGALLQRWHRWAQDVIMPDNAILRALH